MELEQLRPDLQIDESPDRHRMAARIQPYAWVLIYLFVLAGLLGAFGKGWLSRKEMHKAFADLKYESALRQGAQTSIEFHDRSGTERTVIAIPVAYLSGFSITSIVPEPSETISTGDRVNYIFPGSGTDKSMTFYLEPRRTGKRKADIIVNRTSFTISHQIYP